MHKQRLVLVGAGHAHAQVLAAWARQPVPGVELVLVAPQGLAPYSGMVPGWLAGTYPFEVLCIDFAGLAARAGARWIASSVVALDADQRALTLADGQVLEGDLLSLNIGSTLNPPPAPPAGRVLAMRPLSELKARWESLLADPWLRQDPAPLAVTAVGGGAAGVETVLAVCATLRRLVPQRTLLPRLVTRGDRLLPGMAPGAAHRAQAALEAAGVQVQLGLDAWKMVKMPARAPGLLLWAAGAEAHDWPRHSGLAVDGQGYIQVDAQLRSTSHPQVLAVGDCAAWPQPLPKAGVFAVRQGPVLAANLRALLTAGAPARYRPQQRYLALLATANQRAIGAWGPVATEGAWLWRWKDRIDRGFIDRFKSTRG